MTAKIALIGLTVVVLALVGIGLMFGGPTRPVTDQVHRFQDTWRRQGDRPVPACAQVWPPTCPGTRTRPVPACAQMWPSTCPPPREPNR